MNVLLIGGCGSLINNIIIKLNKEGHRIYLITGTKDRNIPYQKVFERYDFTYDSMSLSEIFQSVNPELTLYMGAYDTNYVWKKTEEATVRYSGNMMNILMAYSKNAGGRFLYLSSEEVFRGDYAQNIKEEEPLSPNSYKGMALAQAEEMCNCYRNIWNLDIITLRVEGIYGIPLNRDEVNNVGARMCLEAMEEGMITITEGSRFSLLYETDAVEFIYQFIRCTEHKHSLYHLSASVEISEMDIAGLVRASMGEEIVFLAGKKKGARVVLDNSRMELEFGNPYCCELNSIIEKMAAYMKKNSYQFLNNEHVKPPLWQRIRKNGEWLGKSALPFLENILGFAVAYFLQNRLAGVELFNGVDFYLIYVLLFSVFYGQNQAIFAGILSLLGYGMGQWQTTGSLDILLDGSSYVWIIQLFVLGLPVGYMRDRFITLKQDSEEEKAYLTAQLTDIQDINSCNVRVKDALQAQIVNQSDSVGKIYSITSALAQYNPEEVLFYAAEIVARLMKCKDVAIYVVSNADYARLFSATSYKARSLGNSIQYTKMDELYDTLSEKKVFINRKMEMRFPLMANAVFENDKMQMLIFVWGLPWESMTLGQANLLTVISALIQNEVLRANKYLDALEHERYVPGTRMLEGKAFHTLLRAYLQAKEKELTECTVLRVTSQVSDAIKAAEQLSTRLRLTDYIGKLADGVLYVLLANTSKSDASYVMRRFLEIGYQTDIVEDMIA